MGVAFAPVSCFRGQIFMVRCVTFVVVVVDAELADLKSAGGGHVFAVFLFFAGLKQVLYLFILQIFA